MHSNLFSFVFIALSIVSVSTYKTIPLRSPGSHIHESVFQSNMPQVGFGTYLLRGQTCYDAVLDALIAGYRHIDTAEVYENHDAVGLAIESSGVPRREIFLTSKVSIMSMGYNKTNAFIKNALEELRTPYIDLLLVHFPSPLTKHGLLVWEEIGLFVEADASIAADYRQQTWKAMEEAQARGLVRFLGVSNYLIPHLEELLRYANVQPVVNQLEIHPYLQRRETRRWCDDHGIATIAYSSVVQSGRRDLLDHRFVHEVSTKLNLTPAQVLLRWATNHGLGVLPRSTNLQRIRENLESYSLLPEWAIEKIDSLSCEECSDQAPNCSGNCDAPFPTGCGSRCPRGAYLWSADLVLAKPHFVHRTENPFEQLSVEAAVEIGLFPPLCMAQRHSNSAESIPVYNIPWKLREFESLEIEVEAVTKGWNWDASFAGHGRPLLTVDQLPPQFRDHIVNQPHAQPGLLESCCPTLLQIFTFFAEHTTVMSMRLLRRQVRSQTHDDNRVLTSLPHLAQPLTAYGLHNDADLHVHAGIRRFQIPVASNDAEALLLTTPYISLVPIAARRGLDYGSRNPLLGPLAYPVDASDRDPTWFDRPGKKGYEAERKTLESFVSDFAEIGSVYKLKSGLLNHFDTMRRHTLVNLAKTTRLTLVLDILENDWLRNVMPCLYTATESSNWAQLLAVKGAEGFRASLPNSLLGHLQIERPRDGSTLIVASASKWLHVDLSFRVEAAGALDGLAPLTRETLHLLCGSLFGDSSLQISPSRCSLMLTQHFAQDNSKSLSMKTHSLFNNMGVELDLDRCHQNFCRVSAVVIDSEGLPVLSMAETSIYVNEPTAQELVDRSASEKFVNLPHSEAHGASDGGYLGAGLVFHALAYTQRSALAVVYGSVARPYVAALIRRGQQDAGVGGISRTIVVDATLCGRDDMLKDAAMNLERLGVEATCVSANDWHASIDLLVIDADASFAGSLRDALLWLPFLKKATGIALLLDTGYYGQGCGKTPEVLRRKGFDVVNAFFIGDGIAFIQPAMSPEALTIEGNMGEGTNEVFAVVASPEELLARTHAICDARKLLFRNGVDCVDSLIHTTAPKHAHVSIDHDIGPNKSLEVSDLHSAITLIRSTSRFGVIGLLEVTSPRNGSLIELAEENDEYYNLTLNWGIQFPTPLKRRVGNFEFQLDAAFSVLCSNLIEAEVISSGKGCSLAVTQVSSNSKVKFYTEIVNGQVFTLDLSLCDGTARGRRCHVSAEILDNNRIPILKKADLYVFVDVSISSNSPPAFPPIVNVLQARSWSNLRYSESHGAADGGYLGAGLFYYSTAYAYRAKRIVVLGSGGGFVPSLLRQAQRDCGIGSQSQTVIVDGAIGPWGRPDYLDKNSEVRKKYPELVVWNNRTSDAARMWAVNAAANGESSTSIALLFVDADHSHGVSLEDALTWIPFLQRHRGLVFLHDTGGHSFGCAKTPFTLRSLGYDVVNFVYLGAGFAMLRPRPSKSAMVIDIHGGEGSREVYSLVDSHDHLQDQAIKICGARRWVTLNNTGCVEALTGSATWLLQEAGDIAEDPADLAEAAFVLGDLNGADIVLEKKIVESSKMRAANPQVSLGDNSVGICSVLKNVPTSHLEEWLVWHRIQGVEMFFLYDNNDADGGEVGIEATANRVNARFPEVSIKVIPYQRGVSLTIELQSLAYGDCAITAESLGLMWLAFIDGDEFILVVEDPDEDNRNITLPTKLGSYFRHNEQLRVQWVYPLNGFNNWSTPAHRFIGDENVRVCGHSRDEADFGYKTIVALPCLHGANVHNSVTSKDTVSQSGTRMCTDRDGGRASPTDAARAGVFIIHYHFESVQHWITSRIEKDRNRMWSRRSLPAFSQQPVALYYKRNIGQVGNRSENGLLFYARLCTGDLGPGTNNMIVEIPPERIRSINRALQKLRPRLVSSLNTSTTTTIRIGNDERRVLTADELSWLESDREYQLYASLKFRLSLDMQINTSAYWNYFGKAPFGSFQPFMTESQLEAAAVLHFIEHGFDSGAGSNDSLWRPVTRK